MKPILFAALALTLPLAGCSDPEQAAQQALAEVKSDWSTAQAIGDPEKRLKAWQSALADLTAIGTKYGKTQVGGALAAGRSVDGLSHTTMKSEIDRLAERAACYSRPTVDCLMPFASNGFRTSQGSGAGMAQQAVLLVCDKGFAAADAALEGMKINRAAYASNLQQVALHAAQCEQPDAVRAAINAWLSAEPSQGAGRVSALMTVLNTEGLRAAWPDVVPAVEKELSGPGIDPGSVANADLALANVYAGMGDADKALQKFRHVTEELGYTVDTNSRIELAATLLASGAAQAGMELARADSAHKLELPVLRSAAQQLGSRLGVIRYPGSQNANVPFTGDLTEFYAHVDEATRKREGDNAAQIETELDAFVAPLQSTGEWLGPAGVDTLYGMLALIQQKLGNSDKASALSTKGEAALQKLSRPGSYRPDDKNYLAEFQVLVALGQDDPDKAVPLLARIRPVGNNVKDQVFIALARKGEAEQALTLANAINSAGGPTFELLINELASHGHTDKAEQVLNAFPGSPQVKSAMAWAMVERAAAAGDIKGAQAVADRYQLLANPSYQARMTELQAEAAIARGDKGAVETALRELFAKGEALDAQAAQGRNRGYYAENAAALAFKAGYTDLGLELYRTASSKDQRPFFAAFEGGARPDDFPALLLAAHDNLRGEPLGYVIDSAIRRLRK